MKGNIAKLGLLTLTAAGVTLQAHAIEYNLAGTSNQTHFVTGDVGGQAIFADHWVQPVGTGVFDPFLSLDANGQTSTGSHYMEQAYNTDGANRLYLDEHRPKWNTLLRISDLATINIGNINYFGFILDANEPGAGKSLISIDNIRIYTSSVDNTPNVGNDTSKLNDLGTLRWAMNDGLKNPDGSFNIDTWIKLDADQENIGRNSNGGSGQADMIVYIPVSAFGNSLGTDDFIWFYNLNGVHYNADKDLASTAGFEEWSAVVKLQTVPDGGSTIALLGSALTALGFVARRKTAKKA